VDLGEAHVGAWPGEADEVAGQLDVISHLRRLTFGELEAAGHFCSAHYRVSADDPGAVLPTEAVDHVLAEGALVVDRVVEGDVIFREAGHPNVVRRSAGFDGERAGGDLAGEVPPGGHEQGTADGQDDEEAGADASECSLL
jgi:hypothetical protein